jgi:hypothetical protein
MEAAFQVPRGNPGDAEFKEEAPFSRLFPDRIQIFIIPGGEVPRSDANPLNTVIRSRFHEPEEVHPGCMMGDATMRERVMMIDGTQTEQHFLFAWCIIDGS